VVVLVLPATSILSPFGACFLHSYEFNFCQRRSACGISAQATTKISPGPFGGLLFWMRAKNVCADAPARIGTNPPKIFRTRAADVAQSSQPGDARPCASRFGVELSRLAAAHIRSASPQSCSSQNSYPRVAMMQSEQNSSGNNGS
jgi:hypothetical protein